MVLVTGATGLVGSHVLVALVAKGEHVKAMYRSEHKKQLVKQLFEYYDAKNAQRWWQLVTWYQGDILDLDEVTEALTGCTRVVHCAALVSFNRKDFWRLFEVNRQGTANLVNAAIDFPIQQFVHVSSTAAIGSDALIQDGVKREADHWNANEKVSAYSMSKYSAEKEVWRAMEEGLNAVIVNPSIIFGPGSWDDSSLKIFRTVKNGLTFYTAGANAFVDVRDVADVIIRLLFSEITQERFLVTGTNCDYKTLFAKMSIEIQVKAPNRLANAMLTELAWRLAGISAFLQGKQPTLTKDSARSSQRTTRYSTEKLTTQFPDFQFRALEDTIANTVAGRMD
jgi:dihydroflavonol-4-reductase